jgi:hypothetical protein
MKTKLLTSVIILLFVMKDAKAQTYDFRNFSYPTSLTLQLNPFAPKKDVTGSKFLFPDWVSGRVINNAGQEFSGGARFNFDKMSQNLYVQLKDTSPDVAFLVDKWQLKAIYLNDGTNTYNFEKSPSLDTNFFYRALLKGDKYSLYSRIKTTFIASDYHSNGIVSSGNMYDEYKDELTYYIILPDHSAHEISLRKKAIKSVLKSEEEKVDKFLDNSTGDINEGLVVKLLTTLND